MQPANNLSCTTCKRNCNNFMASLRPSIWNKIESCVFPNLHSLGGLETIFKLFCELAIEYRLLRWNSRTTHSSISLFLSIHIIRDTRSLMAVSNIDPTISLLSGSNKNAIIILSLQPNSIFFGISPLDWFVFYLSRDSF